MELLKTGGLTLGNMMIAGFPSDVYGRPGRDEEIDKVEPGGGLLPGNRAHA
jgi:hypothetical protein